MIELSIPEAATRVGLSPLRLLAYLDLAGLPHGRTVELDTLRAFASSRDLTYRSPGTQGDAAEATGIYEKVHADSSPRRRHLRLLIWKMHHQGRWWPSALAYSAVQRGVDEHERGIARDAATMLLRVGWARHARFAHKAGAAPLALAPEHRGDILRLLEDGESSSAVLTSWIEASAP
jgi:hypothetical protein